MARLIRHNWQSIVVVALILCAVVAVSMITNQTAGPVLGQQVEPVGLDESDVETWQQVDQLRRQLCLTNVDLAAMGCSQQSAEQVLGTLIAWCTMQRGELERIQAQQRDARRALSAVLRRITIGPRDEALIASAGQLKDQLAQADQQHEQKVQSAVDVVGTVLSDQQSALWQTIRRNTEARLPARFRSVDGLNDQQIQTLTRTNRRLTEQALVTNLLSAAQRSAADAAQVRQRQSMPDILAVDRQLLATPLVLRPRSDGAAPPQP